MSLDSYSHQEYYSNNVFPSEEIQGRRVAKQSNVTGKPKVKAKLKNVGNYFEVGSAAIDAIYLHPPVPGVSKYDLVIAYKTLCRSVQQGIVPRVTTAGVESIGKALACGKRHKKRVFDALKSVAFSDGQPIIGESGKTQWGGYSRPTYELPKADGAESIYFPNKTLDKIAANPNTSNRQLDKTRVSAGALRMFLVLFRHYEPIEYWGFNPITSIFNEYGETDLDDNSLNVIEKVHGHTFTFYEKPKRLFTGRVINPELASEVLQKRTCDLTPDDYKQLHVLRNELFKRGYLMYSVLVVDAETTTPLYRLYTSDHDKHTKDKDYMPLQNDVLRLYGELTGRSDELAGLAKNYFVSVSSGRSMEVIGIYSPKFLPSCPESAIMKKNWAENRAFWSDFCQCLNSGV